MNGESILMFQFLHYIFIAGFIHVVILFIFLNK